MAKTFSLLLGALLADSAGLALFGRGGPVGVVAAGVALHATAAWLVSRSSTQASERRLLAAAALVLPIGGCIAALLLATTPRRGTFARVRPPQPRPRAVDRALVRQLREQQPLPELLLSPDGDERAAALALLARRADAETAALLQWAVARGDGDVALGAVLALEDVSRRLGLPHPSSRLGSPVAVPTLPAAVPALPPAAVPALPPAAVPALPPAAPSPLSDSANPIWNRPTAAPG